MILSVCSETNRKRRSYIDVHVNTAVRGGAVTLEGLRMGRFHYLKKMYYVYFDLEVVKINFISMSQYKKINISNQDHWSHEWSHKKQRKV